MLLLCWLRFNGDKLRIARGKNFYEHVSKVGLILTYLYLKQYIFVCTYCSIMVEADNYKCSLSKQIRISGNREVATLRPRKKIMLPSATNPSPKIKSYRIGSGMHPIFVRLGVFHLVWDKKWKMHPTVVLLGAFQKEIENFWLTNPNFQKFCLKAT